MSKKDEILWLDLETGKTRPFSPEPVEEATKWAEREDALHRAALKYQPWILVSCGGWLWRCFTTRSKQPKKVARRGERLDFWHEYIARQQPGYVKKELSPESEATLQFMEKRRKEHIREGNSQSRYVSGFRRL